jgi:hypothetical protein
MRGSSSWHSPARVLLGGAWRPMLERKRYEDIFTSRKKGDSKSFWLWL